MTAFLRGVLIASMVFLVGLFWQTKDANATTYHFDETSPGLPGPITFTYLLYPPHTIFVSLQTNVTLSDVGLSYFLFGAGVDVLNVPPCTFDCG